jgi:hypothetical protein
MVPTAPSCALSKQEGLSSDLEGAINALDDFEFEEIEESDAGELEDGCLSCS